ncbi:MAG: hypothetical protein HAW63_00155 [Bdellovibrionaceae bacterium]|nr:hypothetical protein [Pseudobdellovibrionaceae bacterium]
MLKSFFTALGALLFAIFFLFVLQLDWRGKTLEAHFSSWVKQSSATKILQQKSLVLQKKINSEITERKGDTVDRFKQLTKSIKKKFKRSLGSEINNN